MKQIVIGILAHVDAGKTTLAEALLYNAGVIRKQGRVDRKDSALDTHELERERGITIFAGEASFKLGENEITLLDTPGHVDFSAETERMLQIVDYAVVVISATDGVQAHTRTVWKLLESYGIPVFVFVTKCDLERRTRENIAGELEKEFGAVVDFSLKEGIYTHAENIATCTDELLEEYLSDGKLSTDALARAVKSRRLFPCFFGSGLKNEGVEDFARAVEELTLDREYPTQFGAKVYKISRNKNDRLTKLRVTGGTLRVRDGISYSGVAEKVNQIRIYSGSKYVTVDEAPSGTVCTVTGLTKTQSGQGLGIEKESAPPVLEPVISYRIVLPETVDARLMIPKFKSLEEEDPQLRIKWDERLGEFKCELMGTVQAEILKSIVSERFGVNIEIDSGRVIYKETLTNTVEGVGHYEPLRHYAEVHLLIEPIARGIGVVFDSTCSENALDQNFQRLVLTHLAEKTHLGVLTGSPITDVKITLVSGRAHIKHTEGGDFRQATYRAVRQGLMQADSVLLEPYYNFRLEIPANQIGRATGDIKLMGGKCEENESDGEVAVIRGKAPVVTMGTYMSEVASYTAGTGRLSLELGGYDVCHDAAEVIKTIAYNPEHDLENTPDSVFCAHGAGFTVKWDKVPEYMHIESCFAKKERSERHRHISIDEKELEEIMLREFGPIKRRVYSEPVRVDAADRIKNIAKVKTSCIIVDGYNVIFSWDSLRETAENDLESARDRLCHILSNYSSFTGIRVVLVFDAYRVAGQNGEKLNFHGVDVVYTKENETGDAYIEKLINGIGKNEQVRVVTSDWLIQLSAVRGGILRMSSAEFEKEIDRVDEQIARMIEKEEAKKQ